MLYYDRRLLLRNGVKLRRVAQVVAILAVLLFLAIVIALGPRVVASLDSRPSVGNTNFGRETVLPNPSASGIDFSNLTPETEGACKGLYKIPGTGECTHGPDPAPPGVNIKTREPPVNP